MSEKAENYLDSLDIEDMVMEIDKDGEFIYASQLMESYYQYKLKELPSEEIKCQTFIQSYETTSATICKVCGREKFLH